MSKQKKRGFTLIEILLVVGFIAVAGIGVYTVYNKAALGNAANIESRNIDLIRSGIKNLFAGAPNTIGLTNTVVNNAGITPSPMRTIGSNTSITNSFGGAVSIQSTTLVSSSDAF